MNETPRTWKSAVLARMKERGVSRADLARECDVSDAAISDLFKKNADGSEKVKSSRLKPLIERFLKMPPSTASGVDAAKRDIDDKWQDLDPEDQEAVRQLVNRLSSKKT